MKTLHILPAVLAVCLSSCTALDEDLLLKPEKSADSRALVFEGGFADTKISLGDIEDGNCRLLWSENDEIGIISLDQTETFNDNIKAVLDINSIGMSKGLFIPVDEVTIITPPEGGDPVEVVDSLSFPQENDEQFFVYYPYKKGTSINVDAAGVKSTLAKNQPQTSLGDKTVGRNGFSTSIVDVKAASNKATFSLVHNMAYVAFQAHSSEFSGYQLHSVQLYDAKKEAKLSGDFVYDLGTRSVIPSEKTNWTAKVNVTNHDFKSVPSLNEVYLTVFPGDYSAAEMWVVITFINEEGTTITIPKALGKTCRFPQGSITFIDLGDIKSSDNTCPWYEPVETRGLCDMYAYGHTNTYSVEHLVREVDSLHVPNPVKIDVKARGDFSLLKEPKYFGLVIPSEMGCSSTGVNTRKFLSIDGSTSARSIQRLDVPTGVIDADYTFTVYVLDKKAGTGRWGTVGIYDEEYNLLWSYLIVSYETGDAPSDVVYPEGFTMMDRYLGQVTGNRSAFGYGTFDHTGGNVLPFFQWGRKDPFPWTNTNGNFFFKTEAATDQITIESGIKNPTTTYGYASDAPGHDTHGDWQQEENRTDLWGGYNNAKGSWYDPQEVGHKSVFDPCPDGYRIPDARVLKAVGDRAEIWEAANGKELQVTDPTSPDCYLNPQSPFYTNNISTLAIKDVNGEYDYWFFAGYSSSSSKTFNTSRAGNNTNICLETWANAMSNEDNPTFGRAAVLEYGYWSTARNFNSRHSSQKAYRYPVRCQKID